MLLGGPEESVGRETLLLLVHVLDVCGHSWIRGLVSHQAWMLLPWVLLLLLLWWRKAMLLLLLRVNGWSVYHLMQVRGHSNGEDASVLLDLSEERQLVVMVNNQLKKLISLP